ncbi:MAG: DoxX family protein [Verrucomicrobiota bacterium]
MNKELFHSIGLAILRISFGGFMLFAHGWPKLMKFSDMKDTFPDPLGIGNQLSLISAIGTEVGCALLLMLGLGTRYSAALLAFTMLVAAFIVNGGQGFQKQELALVYLAAYVVLVFTGGGRFSIDQFSGKRWLS